MFYTLFEHSIGIRAGALAVLYIFDMSMVGELTFFLRLQVKQKKEGIFISQEKYARNIVKKFGLDSKKHA